MERGQFTGPLFFGKNLKFLLITLVLLVFFTYYFLTRQVLVIVPLNVSDEKIIVAIEDNKWHLQYTHSVQKTIVEEYFKVQNSDSFLMYKTIYSSFGVGLPFLPGEGTLTFLPDNTMQLDLKTPRIFPVVKLWTGVEAKVSLVTGQNSMPLYEQYPSGTLVQITTCKRYQTYY